MTADRGPVVGWMVGPEEVCSLIPALSPISSFLVEEGGVLSREIMNLFAEQGFPCIIKCISFVYFMGVIQDCLEQYKL